ncbi:S-adenosyl-L-methionine-dependent methyltransferase [Aspergillus pseudodeflectus]|uniref:S-adenosyl-L-methionine-dependent methyltransferase n=1 Tax=Aspergillus pseudodeflectus TaxID=176178 RepID=A0ABR4K5Q1_9EURO
MEPLQPHQLLSLVDELGQAVVEEASSCRSPQSHSRLLSLIDQLRLAVETPTETVLRLIYQPPQNAALRTAIDLGVFDHLISRGRKGISASELSTHTNAERALIVRLMRVITALGLCANPQPEVYQSNSKTFMLTQPIGRDGVRCIYDLTMPTLARLPEYFREHHYTTPKDYSQSPMCWAVGQSQFEWLAQRRHQQVLFNSYMSSRREGRPAWFDVYPLNRLMTPPLTDNNVLLVDVGGNQGHDLVRFRKKHPQAPGRLILQDLPGVVAGHTSETIEAMAYSFLDPQPVKGARTYYFRAIFHDWPDHICQKILQNTVAAMDAHSRIIIVDFVLPDTDTPLLQASLDIQMLSIGSGAERSKRQWIEMLQAAGLEIRGIWSGSPGMESVIEAAPVQLNMTRNFD